MKGKAGDLDCRETGAIRESGNANNVQLSIRMVGYVFDDNSTLICC